MLALSVLALRPTVFTPSLNVVRAPILRVFTEREVVFCVRCPASVFLLRDTLRDTVARFVVAVDVDAVFFSSTIFSVVFFVGIARDIAAFAAQPHAV